jgi:hypothetical protein
MERLSDEPAVHQWSAVHEDVGLEEDTGEGGMSGKVRGW